MTTWVKPWRAKQVVRETKRKFTLRRRKLELRSARLLSMRSREERKRRGKITSLRMLKNRLHGNLVAVESLELDKLDRQAQSRKKKAEEAYLKLMTLVDLKKNQRADSPRVFAVKKGDLFSSRDGAGLSR